MRRLWRAALLAVVLLAPPAPAFATVSTSTRSIQYSPSISTTVFSVTFPFLSKDWLTVTKTTISSGAVATLTQGVDYSVTPPVGATAGYVTTTAAVVSGYRITISRTVPLTQTASLRTQGVLRPSVLEDAFDKLTMIAQQVTVASGGTDGQAAVDTHVGQADPHTQYALLAGRSGGQHLKGGTAASQNLQLSSTAHATKGKVVLGAAGTSAFDEANGRLGIGTASPSVALEVSGDAKFADGTNGTVEVSLGNITKTGSSGTLMLSGSAPASSSAARLYLEGSSNNNRAYLYGDGIHLDTGAGTDIMVLTSGAVTVGTNISLNVDSSSYMKAAELRTSSGTLKIGTSIYNDSTNRLGIGTYTPTHELEVHGQISGRRPAIFAAAAYTVDPTTDCGAVIFDATDTGTVTLPALSADVEGCQVTLVNRAADDAALVKLSPNAADKIVGTCVGVQFTEVADRDALNTKSGSNHGDYITVVADYTSSPAWYTVGCVGVWAKEP